MNTRFFALDFCCPQDTQSIKGDSKSQVERERQEKRTFDEKQKKNTPDAETLMQYDNLMKEGVSAQGTKLTDEVGGRR